MPRIAGDGVSLAVFDEGAGPPVLLLHGFPDSSHVWRHQVPALVAAGMRALAPDLRGFGESDRPEGVEEYGVMRSVADVLALLDGLGIERARLVAHDFGAAVAWVLAALHPDRVERLVALSVGHPNARDRSIDARQKAWYQLWFQFEGVAEEVLTRDDWKLFREWSRGAADLERYVADLSRPGALVAALNWYRANTQPARELQSRQFPPVAAPTLGLWSTGDEYLTEASVRDSGAHVIGGWRYERIEGASHWLQLDAPERVNALLLEFLAP
jgi:pimeloyl-ACP methyl ester carboxylesterase